jgi:hypothetical protein
MQTCDKHQAVDARCIMNLHLDIQAYPTPAWRQDNSVIKAYTFVNTGKRTIAHNCIVMYNHNNPIIKTVFLKKPHGHVLH